MSKPSDGFTLDELREEYDWMSDFMGRMAQRIRGDADVRSLAAYVAKLEGENAKLRSVVSDGADNARELRAENAKLREACAELLKIAERYDPEWFHWPELHDELRELGVEVE